jgi:hypothetical protein
VLKNRKSKLSDPASSFGGVVCAAALSMSCGGAMLTTVTAAELEKMPRKPDGVALDLPPAVPSSSERAPARGVVSLREPLSDERANDVVRAYMAAFLREDTEGLSQFLGADAVPLDTRGSRGALIESWRTRFRNLDYGKLAGTELVDYSTVERYSLDDLSAASRPPRPATMREDDLLLRVPITTPRVSGERFFGDFVTLLLRRESSAYRIVGVGEEDAP